MLSAELMSHHIRELSGCVDMALSEDIGAEDLSTLATIPAESQGRARIVAKSSCVVAGTEVATKVFRALSNTLRTKWYTEEGEEVEANCLLGEVSGCLRSILSAERVALNCLQRMSGIATYTRRLVRICAPYACRLLDTRKTSPNFRVCERMAVRIGGAYNHRFGLDDAVLIKDNHIDACRGVDVALDRCARWLRSTSKQVPVMVEVRNMEELRVAALHTVVDRILLDNVSPTELKVFVDWVAKRKDLEASGGINEHNVAEYAATGVDYVSVGALTHALRAVDMSLNVN